MLFWSENWCNTHTVCFVFFSHKERYFFRQKGKAFLNLTCHSTLEFYWQTKIKLQTTFLFHFLTRHHSLRWLIKLYKKRSAIFDVVLLNSLTSWLIQFHLIFSSFLFADFIFKYLVTFGKFLSWFSKVISHSFLSYGCTFSYYIYLFNFVNCKYTNKVLGPDKDCRFLYWKWWYIKPLFEKNYTLIGSTKIFKSQNFCIDEFLKGWIWLGKT